MTSEEKVFIEKTIESERIYEGAILNLRRDKVTVKNGGTSYREVVEHRGGAVAAAITDDRQIVLVRQYRKPVDRVVLEAPAGKIDPGEDPRDTVIRELKEETGYRAGKVEHMTDMWPSVGYTEEKLYIYLARELTEGEPCPDENEAIQVVKIDLDEAVKMVKDGEISDGKTIIAILMANLLL